MPKQFPPEVRDRAVRMTLDRLPEYPSVFAACKALAPKLGVGTESLRRWVVQALVDAGRHFSFAGLVFCGRTAHYLEDRKTPGILNRVVLEILRL